MLEPGGGGGGLQISSDRDDRMGANAHGTRGNYPITNLQIVLNTPKKSHLNQATPPKNRQSFPTQGKPIIKIFLPKGIL